MKRYTYLLIMLLCLPQFNHTAQSNAGLNDAQAAKLIVGLGVLAVAILSYEYGEFKGRKSKEAILKQEQLERKAKEDAQQEQQNRLTQRFHQVESMRYITKAFDHFKKQTHTDLARWPHAQQENFMHKVIEISGSVTIFETQLNQHIKNYEKFDPEMACTHKELHETMLWLERAVHTNPYVSSLKKQEKEEAFKQAQRDASLKRVQHEAQAAQDLVAAIAQVREMATRIESSSRRSAETCTRQISTLESVLNGRLIELNGWQSRRVSEHQEMIGQFKKLQESMGKLHKKTDKAQKDIASIKDALTQERSNNETAPSAPPQEECPSYQPPAYNPDYRPTGA